MPPLPIADLRVQRVLLEAHVVVDLPDLDRQRNAALFSCARKQRINRGKRCVAEPLAILRGAALQDVRTYMQEGMLRISVRDLVDVVLECADANAADLE